jgi:hypothetical protein
MPSTSSDKWPLAGIVNRRGVFGFTHRVLIGASGAITGQDADSRVVLTKQGTAGQYKVQLPRGYKRFTSKDVDFTGNTNSVVADWLTDQVTTVAIPGGSIAGTIDGSIILQLRNSAGAATDLPSTGTMTLRLEVENGV